jgi:hypothetical protein
MMDLRAIRAEGEHGMNAYSQLDAAVWQEYVDNLLRLYGEATAIRVRLQDGSIRPANPGAMMAEVDIEQQHRDVHGQPFRRAAARGTSRTEARAALPRLHGS